MIQFEKKDKIAYITLNRPDKFNSINKPTALAFQEALDDCHHDNAVRCVIISGVGRAFCAGQDLGEIVDPNGPPLDEIVGQHYNPIIMKIRNMPKPVIAAINGVAAGAGANIGLACDIVVAKHSATFLQAFSKIGLIPDSGGTYTLPRLVGQARASALMMLAEKVSAQDAEKIGMIYKAIPDEAFEETVEKMATKLANMPTIGLAQTKKLLNISYSNDLEAQLVAENEAQNIAGVTDDYAEGVKAFLEKRKPTFYGK